ncbi:hypothetical protein Poli38472_001214 [Pythium oligandrum]|uniref:Uncharacterized protein n=1 Tax=Pythium oligandrum TaxID=41045 RepID=A0A8K1FSZ6_PYTOL|nr:hypothetical protein Poli38472_001214 [Pythium oligandrum]|eukprot:TMW69058.1 hypothetical protein Poli38472_001214 [Pythium oligandrum]
MVEKTGKAAGSVVLHRERVKTADGSATPLQTHNNDDADDLPVLSIRVKGIKRETSDSEQQQDDEEDDEDALDDEDDDDAKSYTSNQTEDDSEEDPEALDQDVDHDSNNNGASKPQVDPADAMKQSMGQSSKPVVVTTRSSHAKLPAALSLSGLDPSKGIQEPRHQRGSGSMNPASSTVSSKQDKKARHKFQFPDAELLKLMLEQEKQNAWSSALATSSTQCTVSSSSLRSSRRRFSSASIAPAMLPLRRKSFSLTKGPIKNLATEQELVSPAKTRLPTRRKSTSACLFAYPRSPKSPTSVLSSLPMPSLPPLTPPGISVDPFSSSSTSSTTPQAATAASQMVVRVRGRKSDGKPEVVISKRPARFFVWQWNDRQVRIPFMIQLGPHQHGIMLRQLRYVKSVMNDFPWAKTHLKELLAAYTKKEMSKEELYPQLNQLSNQVQEEIGSHIKKQKQLFIKKQRLTTQLSVATGVLNDLQVTKHGRHGKPHDTKLCYDPGQPTKLQWIRKNGDQSSEVMAVDEITIQCYSDETNEEDMSVGMKKAIKKFPNQIVPSHSLSLVTATRTLDLQLKSPMHREWLVTALHDVISFARQYKAAGARRQDGSSAPAQHNSHILRRM